MLAEPKSFGERADAASTCVRTLHIRFPALVDNFLNTTEAAYMAWPDRLYVIDRDGRIAYKSAPGPWGFHPKRVADTLQKLLP